MKNIFVPAILIFLIACNGGEKKSLVRTAPPTPEEISGHFQDIAKWRTKRINDLKGHDGWLNLVGLYWLKEGINSFGSDEGSDVVFPKGKIAPRSGYFVVKSGEVALVPQDEKNITIYGAPVSKETNIFHPDSARAAKSFQGSVVRRGSLEWYVIKRDDKLGIRARDLESKAVKEFEGIESYPVSYDWYVPARFEPATNGKTIDITNVLGQTTAEQLAGTYVFEYAGKEYQLAATGKGKELFIVFGDSTNNRGSYPAGRFVYANRPDSLGNAFIDFNKSYNPPCAFTEFATCPLPPRQNVLPIAIMAGEKNYDHKIK